MDAKFFEIDNRMEALRTKTASFPAKILKDYRDRLDISWIFHDGYLGRKLDSGVAWKRMETPADDSAAPGSCCRIASRGPRWTSIGAPR